MSPEGGGLIAGRNHYGQLGDRTASETNLHIFCTADLLRRTTITRVRPVYVHGLVHVYVHILSTWDPLRAIH